VARELRLAIGLAPLLFTRISSPWCPGVVATDASEFGGGVVAIEQPTARVVAAAHGPFPGPDVSHDRPPRFPSASARWSTIVACPWRRGEHINVLELRAFMLGVEWQLSRPRSRGSRLLFWADSSVLVGAVRKGRSSSFALLVLLRRLAALSLVTDTQVHVNWVPTEVNPADGPSRRYAFDSTLGFPGEGPPRSFLYAFAHEPRTRVRYARAVLEFVQFLSVVGASSVQSVKQLDTLFSEWCHELFAQHGGKRRSVAVSALAGVHLFLPEAKSHLVYSALALRGWGRAIPSIPHPPITWEMAVAIGTHMVLSGHFSWGVGVLLCFDCYLRQGELLQLSVRDVVLPSDTRLGAAFANRCALRLGKTKTGREQFVEVLRPDVILLLSILVNAARTLNLAPATRLFAASPSRFLRAFKRGAAAFNLDPNVVVHSCRHGGATGDFLLGKPMADIQNRGRWASLKSAQHYIQMGRSLLVASTSTVPRSSLALAEALAADVKATFASALSQSTEWVRAPSAFGTAR